MIVIDSHAHWVPQDFPKCPSDVPEREWPEMVPLEDGRARMMLGEKEFRIFTSEYWDVAGRIEYLDRHGVSFQILSPLPELLGYWWNSKTTAAVADHINHSIAETVASAPARFAGLGMLPLQDIDRSLKVLEQVNALGLRGLLVASNVNGVSLADSRFDPVFKEIERLGLAILIHGYRPAGTERMLGSPILEGIVGVPQDTMALIASFIMTDILKRFPALKLGFVHGGGAFGAVLDRLDHTWRGFPQMQQAVSTSPRDYVRRFYFDTVTFSVDYLRFIIKAFGADSLFAGSDGPNAIGQHGLEAFVMEACDGDVVTAEKILWRNAVRFFVLDNLDAEWAPG